MLLAVTSVVPSCARSVNLYFYDSLVRILVLAAAFPNKGLDNLYKVTNGAAGQFGIASVAPGSLDYHGGHWKVFTVTFNIGITPVLLTSEQAVLSAQNAGRVAVTRNSAADFLCPIQP